MAFRGVFSKLRTNTNRGKDRKDNVNRLFYQLFPKFKRGHNFLIAITVKNNQNQTLTV